MRHPLRLIVAAALALASSGVGATAMTQTIQEKQPATPASPSLIAPSTKNPYAKLFQPRPRELRQLEADPLSEPKRRPSVRPGTHEPEIECKIRVILADPSKDRGIRVSKPSAEAQFAIRILEHPCLKQ